MAPVFKCAPMMWICWTLMLMLNALHGCTPPPPPASSGTTPVVISGKTYTLEVAAEDAVRMKGMGGRKSIAEDGGMIFAFPSSQARVMGFVMRDCPIDIDIIYLDGAGRVLSFYEMKKEEPRNADGTEGKEGDMDNKKYEGRLHQYSSKFRCTFAVELQAGSIKKLGVKEGDLLTFDADGLKRIAK